MKKITLLIILITNYAFADDMMNQQYVAAAQPSKAQLQAPFGGNQTASNPGQQQVAEQQPEQQNTNSNSPMNIYVSPSQPQQQQQTLAQNDQQQPYNQYQALAQSQNAMQPQMNQANPSDQNDMNNGQQLQQQASGYQQQMPTNNSQTQTMATGDSGWQTRPDASAGNSNNAMQQSPNQAYPSQDPSQGQAYYQQQAAPQTNYPMNQPSYAQQAQQQAPQQAAPQIPSQVQPQAPASVDNSNNPQVNTAPANQPMAAAQSSGPYDDQAKQNWFNHCLPSVTDKTMQQYAQPFCQCGWDKISGGGLDPNLLTSQNPADIQKANMILRGISQECLVQVMGQGQSQGQGQG